MPEPAPDAAPEPVPESPSEPQGGPRELAAALAALAADPRRAPVLVALDFDGTLAPLQDDPERSRILPAGVVQLGRLADAGVALAVLSGRGLDVLARLAQVPVGTVLVGSHGAEVARLGPSGPDRPGALLTSDQAARHAAAQTQLGEVARGRDGVWVEVKPAAAVLHTRLAEPDVADQARARARAVAARLGIEAKDGKDVVELAVVDADKGTALTQVRTETGATTVVYAGDDRTDEDALAVLCPGDLGIKVGEGPTRAAYRLPDPEAMVEALRTFADAVERQHRRRH